MDFGNNASNFGINHLIIAPILTQTHTPQKVERAQVTN